MEYRSVESLLPLSEAAPCHDYDPASGTAYTVWQLLDAGLFYLVIPERYVPRTDIFLRIDETTKSFGFNHAWEITTTLLRPCLNPVDLESPRQTVRLECVSPESPIQISRRVIQATGIQHPGCVGIEAMQSGDLISLELRRVPATSLEDPLGVRVFHLQVGIQLSDIRVSTCPGRLGYIIDSVRDLFNEASQSFISDEFILRSVNRCVRELAQANYWCKETLIAASVGVERIDLGSVIPDLQNIHQVCFQQPEQIMERVPNFREFTSLRSPRLGLNRPQYYTVQGNMLYVYPPPSSDADPGFIVFHSYLPPEIQCVGELSQPPVPPAYDAMLGRYVLKEAFLRDRSSPDANIMFQHYSNMYEQDKQRLLGQATPSSLSLRPTR